MTYAKRMAEEREADALKPYANALNQLGAVVKGGKVTLTGSALAHLIQINENIAAREGEARAEARLKDYSFELISAKLKELTKTPFDQFQAAQTAGYQADVDAVLRKGETFAATDLTPDTARALSSCFTFKVEGWGKKAVYTEVKANDKAETYAAACGEKAREYAEQAFLSKAAQKLSNIVDRKGALKHVSGTADCTRGVVTAYMTFNFADGSSFGFKHKVIVNSTARGDRFYQFPSTFHDVKLANGDTIAFPSEEKMVTVFAA